MSRIDDMSREIAASPGGRRTFIAFLIVLAVATSLALFLALVVYRPYDTPSTAMSPTLLEGDYFWVSRMSYAYAPPERGDVAVFRLPREPATLYIKRVIGLPGETIAVEGGRVLIDGKPVSREPAPAFASDEAFAEKAKVDSYVERLDNGRSYRVLDTDPRGPLDWAGPFKIPAGHYFVMGDNRDNTVDSRIGADDHGVGFVPIENFIGRAAVIYFSAGPHGVRWQRIGLRVR